MADNNIPGYHVSNIQDLNGIYGRIQSNKPANSRYVAKAAACDKDGDGIEAGQEENEFLLYLSTNGGPVTVYDASGVPTRYYLSEESQDGLVSIRSFTVNPSDEAVRVTIPGETLPFVMSGAELETRIDEAIVNNVQMSGNIATPVEMKHDIMMQQIMFRLMLAAAKADARIKDRESMTDAQLVDAEMKVIEGTVQVSDDEVRKELREIFRMNLSAQRGAPVSDEEFQSALASADFNPRDFAAVRAQLIQKKAKEEIAKWKDGLLKKAKIEIKDQAIFYCHEILGKRDAYLELSRKSFDVVNGMNGTLRDLVADGGVPAEKITELAKLINGKKYAEAEKFIQEMLKPGSKLPAKTVKILGELLKSITELDGLVKSIKKAEIDALAMLENFPRLQESVISRENQACLMLCLIRTFPFNFGDEWVEKRLLEAAKLSNSPYVSAILIDNYYGKAIIEGPNGTFSLDETMLKQSLKELESALKKSDQQGKFRLLSLMAARYLSIISQIIKLAEKKVLDNGSQQKNYEDNIRRLREHAEKLQGIIVDGTEDALEIKLGPADLESFISTGQLSSFREDSLLVRLCNEMRLKTNGLDASGKMVEPKNLTTFKEALETLLTKMVSVQNDAMVPEEQKVLALMQTLNARLMELAALRQQHMASAMSSQDPRVAQAFMKMIESNKEEAIALQIQIETINDFMELAKQRANMPMTLASLRAFVVNDIKVYEDFIAWVPEQAKGLQEALKGPIETIYKNAWKMVEKDISQAKERGDIARLMVLGRSKFIYTFSFVALVAAMDVSKASRELIEIGDLIIERLDDMASKMGIADAERMRRRAYEAYRKAVQLSSDPAEIRSVAYRMMQCGMYKDAWKMLVKARGNAAEPTIDAEIKLCDQTGADMPELGLSVKDNTLVPMAAIYGAMKCMGSDISSLTEEQVQTAVGNAYRRNGYRAMCRPVKNGVWTIYVMEQKIARIVIDRGGAESQLMYDKYIMPYLPKVGEVLDESKVLEAINNLRKCNPDVFKDVTYNIEEGPNGATLTIKVTDMETAGQFSLGGGADSKTYNFSSSIKGIVSGQAKQSTLGEYFGAQELQLNPFKWFDKVRLTKPLSWFSWMRSPIQLALVPFSLGVYGLAHCGLEATGKVLDMSFSSWRRKNYENDTYVSGGNLDLALPVSNTTSLLAGGEMESGDFRSLYGGFRHQWDPYFSSSHVVKYEVDGKNRYVGLRNGLTWDHGKYTFDNPFTPISGWKVSTFAEGGRVTGGMDDLYYKASVSASRYLSVLPDIFDDRLVLGSTLNLGGGRNLSRNSMFRIDKDSLIAGNYLFGGEERLSYNMPTFGFMPAWQLYFFGAGGYTPRDLSRVLDPRNLSYAFGPGLSMMLPLVGETSVYYDIKQQRVGFTIMGIKI